MDLQKVINEVWHFDSFQEELAKLPKDKPDFNKYLQDVFSEEEFMAYKETISKVTPYTTEIEVKAHNTYWSFLKMKPEKMEAKYLITDHTKTKTYATLRAIDYVLRTFRSKYYEDDVDEFTEPENAFNKVYSLVKTLNYEVARVTMEEIRTTISDYNIYLHINKGLKYEKWEFMQIEFLNLFDAKFTPLKEKKEVQFADFIKTDKVKDIEGLKTYLQNLKIGKELAYGLYYLENVLKVSEVDNKFLPFLRTLHTDLKRDVGLREYYVNMYHKHLEDDFAQPIKNQIDTYC